jgi:hypothetical protein
MTFYSLYGLDQRGPLDRPVVGVSVDDWTIDQLPEHARQAIEATGAPIDRDLYEHFAARPTGQKGVEENHAASPRYSAAVYSYASARRPRISSSRVAVAEIDIRKVDGILPAQLGHLGVCASAPAKIILGNAVFFHAVPGTGPKTAEVPRCGQKCPHLLN